MLWGKVLCTSLEEVAVLVSQSRLIILLRPDNIITLLAYIYYLKRNTCLWHDVLMFEAYIGLIIRANADSLLCPKPE